MKQKPLRIAAPGARYQIQVIGHRRAPLRDFYHLVLRISWATTFVLVGALYLAVNGLFAVGYLVTGGLAHARPGSLADTFFFSVQTMGTIGYGAVYPETPWANVLVVTESFTGLILTALVTGLVFAKFSRSTARMSFTREAVISPVNGQPSLSFRVTNERSNRIVDAQIRAVAIRRETTTEGSTFYRMVDLRLSRDRALSLTRSWTAIHPIDEHSPFWNQTPESIDEQELEVQVLIVGLDETTMQTVHAGHRYFAHQLLWGARHVDVLVETADGNVVLDLTKFHDTEPTAPTNGFPHPRP